MERADITEYLASLAARGISGLSRARKLAAIREFFRYLVDQVGELSKSPADGIPTPKKEKNSRTWLISDEYSRMLSLAGGNPRDYAILQVFLQTGLRVGELIDLKVDDADFTARLLQVRGKGMVSRDIPLEKKAIQALRSWLAVRPDDVEYPHLFLNRYGEPISERGVRKLVVKYRIAAGIAKRASCHSLRHTMATYKAEQGVNPFQLKEWLGHARLDTTQIYVHLSKRSGRKVMERTSL